MGIAPAELVWRKVGLAEVRADRINNRFLAGGQAFELSTHRVAAHKANAGELRERFGDSLLQRLQPKRTLPRRTRGIQFVENGEETAAAIMPEMPHDWDQGKRNSARLIAVVHVMQNNVIEFRARELTGFLDLEGPYL